MRSLLLLLAALAIVVGCSRKESRQPEAIIEEQPAAAENSQERSITLSPSKTQPKPVTEAVRVVRESRPGMQRDQILSIRGGGVYGPEDFEIGELQGYSDDENVRAILDRIQAFQEGLESASVPIDDIHPAWRSSAQRSLLFHLGRGNIPSEVRVGTIEIYEPGKARANIRLTGNPGIAIGEIYLDNTDGLWLVSDLQLDMQDLAESPEKRDEPYEPSVYRMTNMP